jgi:DNA-entry nuclease
MKMLLNYKKIFGMIMAILVLVTSFAACGNSEAGDALTTTENNAFEYVSDDALEDIDDSQDSEAEASPEAYKPVGNGFLGVNVDEIPAFSGSPYVAINDNVPSFSSKEITAKSYEQYSALDSLGRCSVVIACLGEDIMPTEERGSIGQVKPSGWHTVKYDFVDGKYLYNRCHLIGFQLSGENANTKNLITGTRYMNVQGMLPFENMVADYIKETNNHVMYRVTPIFEGDELVARGVQIEAYSVEDEGDGICFNVYCYNVQPGVEIDYLTGESVLAAAQETTQATEASVQTTVEQTTAQVEQEQNVAVATKDFVLNTNTKKYHEPWCGHINKMSDKNRQDYNGTAEELASWGYVPCKVCH